MLDAVRRKINIFRKYSDSTYEVRIQPLDTILLFRHGENLLEALLRKGIEVPCNCRVGVCKSCRIKVVEGVPKSLIKREYVFTHEEIETGAYLACQTQVVSDMNIVLLNEEINIRDQAQPFTAQLKMIQHMTPRIYRVQLVLDVDCNWRVGQFAKLLPEEIDSSSRCYSLINSGTEQRVLSFDITRYAGGKVSSWLTNSDNIGKSILVEAPCGEFGVVNELSIYAKSYPLLFIAGGSAIGVICGIIAEHVKSSTVGHSSSPVMLIIGVRDNTEIYGVDVLKCLLAALDISYHICVVLDSEPPGSQWSGRRGYIDANLVNILQEASDSSPCFQQPYDLWQVLLCGPSPLIDTSIRALEECGFHADQMSFDKFEQNLS